MGVTKLTEGTEEDITRCELCEQVCFNRSGCSRCGRLVCEGCLAAYPEDEQPDEPVCEECF